MSTYRTRGKKQYDTLDTHIILHQADKSVIKADSSSFSKHILPFSLFPTPISVGIWSCARHSNGLRWSWISYCWASKELDRNLTHCHRPMWQSETFINMNHTSSQQKLLPSCSLATHHLITAIWMLLAPLVIYLSALFGAVLASERPALLWLRDALGLFVQSGNCLQGGAGGTESLSLICTYHSWAGMHGYVHIVYTDTHR